MSATFWHFFGWLLTQCQKSRPKNKLKTTNQSHTFSSYLHNSTYLHLDFYLSTYKYKRHSRAICYTIFTIWMFLKSTPTESIHSSILMRERIQNKRKLNSIGCPPTPQKLDIFSLVKKKMLKTGGWARVVFAPPKMYLLTHP